MFWYAAGSEKILQKKLNKEFPFRTANINLKALLGSRILFVNALSFMITPSTLFLRLNSNFIRFQSSFPGKFMIYYGVRVFKGIKFWNPLSYIFVIFVELFLL